MGGRTSKPVTSTVLLHDPLYRDPPASLPSAFRANPYIGWWLRIAPFVGYFGFSEQRERHFKAAILARAEEADCAFGVQPTHPHFEVLEAITRPLPFPIPAEPENEGRARWAKLAL